METLIATLGALLLLGSWIAQQFFTDRWSARLAEIQGALTHFYIYQSNCNHRPRGLSRFRGR
jgi:hypothetical protein